MNIVVLTGAGISAESGLPTFRDSDPSTGSGQAALWEGHRMEDVATPEAFGADPDLVHHFYDARRAALDGVRPNVAHEALARLEQVWTEQHRGDFLLVTQNVDDLHDRAGSQALLHLHGGLRTAWCTTCDAHPVAGTTTRGVSCPHCGAPTLRPDVVWFGEVPRGMGRVAAALDAADLFVSIGTSGAVYPAAGFVQHALVRRAWTIELNLAPSEGSIFFADCRLGPATTLVPSWVAELTGH